MSDLYASPSAFLPLPRVPNRPKGPSADLVASVVGEELAAPLREAEALHAEVRAAVAHVETHRPGQMGKGWKAALDEDAADLAAGRTPSKWRAAELLEDDPQRWVTARLLCGAFARRWREAEAKLDHDAIRKAAQVRAALLSSQFAKVAEQAWKQHGNPAKAWPIVGEGERLITEWSAAQEVAAWRADKGDPLSFSLDGDRLPGGPIAAGCWIATDLALRPKKRLMGVPKNVIWPEGAERIVRQFMPVGYSSLVSRGVVETEEVY